MIKENLLIRPKFPFQATFLFLSKKIPFAIKNGNKGKLRGVESISNQYLFPTQASSGVSSSRQKNVC